MLLVCTNEFSLAFFSFSVVHPVAILNGLSLVIDLFLHLGATEKNETLMFFYKTTVRVAGVKKVIPDGQPDSRLYSISQTGWYGEAALLPSARPSLTPQCLS